MEQVGAKDGGQVQGCHLISCDLYQGKDKKVSALSVLSRQFLNVFICIFTSAGVQHMEGAYCHLWSFYQDIQSLLSDILPEKVHTLLTIIEV